jgi:hypothetical protein
MKYLYTIILLCFLSNLKSQNFSPLYKSSLKDRLFEVKLIDSTSYDILIHSFSENTFYNGGLLKIENKIIEENIDTFKIDYPSIVTYKKNINDTIILFSGIFQNNYTKTNIGFSQYYQNQINTKIIGDTTITEIGYRTIFDPFDSKFIICGSLYSPTSDTGFIRKYSIQGNLINEQETNIQVPRTMFKNSVFYYIIDISSNIHKFDYNLTSYTSSTLPFDNISFSPRFSEGHINLNDSTTLLCGTKSYWQGTITQDDDYKTCGIYKFTNGIVTNIYEDSSLFHGSENVKNGYLSIDFIDTNIIYYGFTDGNCIYQAFETADCVNDVLIYSIDLQGNLNWSKKLGGDAKYYIYKILATQDLGCLVFVGRYHPNIPNNNEEDVYYIKLDKNGNVEENYFSKITGVKSIEVTNINFVLFPNPSLGVYQVKTDIVNQNLILEIYDGVGKIILTKAVKQNSLIDLQNYPNTLFFYTIKIDTEVVKTGKLIKK